MVCDAEGDMTGLQIIDLGNLTRKFIIDFQHLAGHVIIALTSIGEPETIYATDEKSGADAVLDPLQRL